MGSSISTLVFYVTVHLQVLSEEHSARAPARGRRAAAELGGVRAPAARAPARHAEPAARPRGRARLACALAAQRARRGPQRAPLAQESARTRYCTRTL